MKNIETLIKELTENSDEAIVSPATKARLKSQGVDFNEPPIRSLEENLELLFKQRKSVSLEIARRLPEPPVVASPAVESLYNEISEAIIFGLNGAAITLSGVLVEFVLKYTTFTVEMGGFAKYDPDKWDEFENFAFAAAIKRAAKAGLLTDENVKNLESFKNNYRNPYNHYNIRKITDAVVFEGAKRLNVEKQEIDTVDVAARDNIIFQATAKRLVDAADVLDVFVFADSVVKGLFSNLNDLLRQQRDNETRA